MTATSGATAVGGDLTVNNVYRAPAGAVEWPVLVGQIPNPAGYFQHRPEADTLQAALAGGGAAVLGQVVTGTGGVGKTQLAAHYANRVWQASQAAAAQDPQGAQTAGARSGGPGPGSVPGRGPEGSTAGGLAAAAAGWADSGPARTDTAGPDPADGAVGAVGVVDLVVWVNADHPEAVTTAYAQAARSVEPGRYDTADAEDAAAGFLAWLRSGGRRWLIVLDNVAEPGALTGLWPPEILLGRTVVTTRGRHPVWTTSTRTLLPVGVYTPQQSLTYLRRALDRPERAGRGDTDQQYAALAADLGHLPIALAQAAAYLAGTPRTIARYRALLADRARRLERSLPDIGGLPDQQQRTVAALWDLSIEQADDQHPPGLARPLLELAAVLDPDRIPDLVLMTHAARVYLAWAGRPVTGGADGGLQPVTASDGQAGTESGDEGEIVPVDEVDVEDALAVLHRLNLLDHAPTPVDPEQDTRDTSGGAPGRIGSAGRWGTVRIHRLVQHAVRDSTPCLSRRTTLLQAAGHALHHAWPKEDHHDRDLATVLRTNTDLLSAHDPDAFWYPDTGAHPALRRAGLGLLHAGLNHAAVRYWHQLAADAERLLSPDHPYILTTRDNLASSYWQAGRTAEAIALLEEVVSDAERVLGTDHPDTLTARGNLAASYWQAGRTAEAVLLQEQVLADAERLLGTHHPNTLTARGNLAASYREAGRTAEAIVLQGQVLADAERVLGAHHPDTLNARASLAASYREAGRTTEAIALQEQVLADRERILGTHHPDTLSTRHNLAASYREAGRTTEAIALEEQVLADRERIIGTDHPDTITARGSLAASYREAGRTTEAIALQEEVLADRERIIGTDHPETLNARNGLAASYHQAGRTSEAFLLQEQVLADAERLLGTHHPNTLTARGNLAASYREAGRTAEAIALLRSVVGGRARVLGDAHPVTAHSRVGLSVVLVERGRSLLPGDVAGAWRDAAEAAQAVGPHLDENPGTYGPALAAAYRLAADTLKADGQREAAAEYRRRALLAAGAAASAPKPARSDGDSTGGDTGAGSGSTGAGPSRGGS
ncbi:tetratricopeptide repeat protein [Kitasatospora sp. NPDC054939]